MEMYIADAFTKVPFSGNPAAVCLLDSDISSEMKQKIASEMNLSETAFALPLSSKGDEFKLQWFTPTCEVPLCGHATLATAAVIFSRDDSHRKLTFSTLSGNLIVSRDEGEGEGKEGPGFLSMDFPLANMTLEGDWTDVEDVVRIAVGSRRVHSLAYSSSTRKLLVRLEDAVGRAELESLDPDTNALLAAHSGRVRGVIVTTRGGEGGEEGDYDFLSRYFAPWNGIPEDPVTGSAHTLLAHYWSQQLCKDCLLARQCSRRGGDVRMKVLPGNRVQLAGQACVVMKGQFLAS